jgi:hypothetical protein
LLSLLQAGDIGLREFQPGEEIRQSLVDVVDVERCDLHGGIIRRLSVANE